MIDAMSVPRLLFVIVLLMAVSPAQAQIDTGRIVFDGATHNFGPIEEGQVVRHVFTFRNEGDADLRVQDVRPSCGCTSPTWTSEPVPPGQSGEIVAAFDSEDRVGPFRKSIRVVTDGEPAEVVLHIAGVVQPTVLHGPSQGAFVFDRVEAAVPRAGGAVSFRAQNEGKRPVRILEVEAPEAFSVAWPKTPLFTDEVVTIRIMRRAGTVLSQSAVPHRIRLITDDTAQPTKTLQLH